VLSEGLRHEVGGNRDYVNCTWCGWIWIKTRSSHKESADFVKEFYQSAIPADAIARTIAFAIEQPANVDVNQIVLRPTVQDFNLQIKNIYFLVDKMGANFLISAHFNYILYGAFQ
jgi:NADP-dependent 3-hydroxy acid dehydrogenase YdfG